MINFNKKDSVADAVDSILKKEEVERLDEVGDTPKGREGLKKYVKTAAKDAVVQGFALGDAIKSKNWEAGSKAGTRSKARVKGIERATDRLTKEETVDEELKGNQHKIDKNHNNKIDAQDFKILRGKKSLKSFKKENEEHSVLDQMINEVLSKDASAGAWIHDFVHSDNPKFAGKSKDKRKEMALAAYYAKQRNEEVEQLDEVGETTLRGYLKARRADRFKSAATTIFKSPDSKEVKTHNKKEEGIKRASKKLEPYNKHLDPKPYVEPKSSTPKKPMSTSDAIAKDYKDQEKRRGIGHVRDHVETDAQVMGEGWDDMVKAAKDSVKSGPKPSGGSGVKQGTRYGGGKQTSKPEQEDDDKKKVTEGKQPLDNVPFDPPYNTTSSPEVKDKSGAVHTPMSRVKHLARQAMKKVKKNLGK